MPTPPRLRPDGARTASARRIARWSRAGRESSTTWLVVGLSVLLVGVTAVLGATVYDERRWSLVFEEDFDVPVAVGEFEEQYRERWGVYPDGWPSTNGAGRYQPSETVSVHDGAVDIFVGETSAGPAGAALVPRLPTYGQLHGRYSVRFRADPVPGYKVAFLLWPDSERWPDDGEIDFPEGNLDGTISAFAHHADSSGSQEQFGTDQDFGRWHVATTEWEPGRLRFYLDDTLIGESTTKVPATSMHWVLQTEVADAPPPAGAQGHVYLDWVKAWTFEG